MLVHLLLGDKHLSPAADHRADLEPPEIVALQCVSRQFLSLARDNNLWKQLCFEHSYTERRRRRRNLLLYDDPDPGLVELLRAADAMANAFPTAIHDPSGLSAELQAYRNTPK